MFKSSFLGVCAGALSIPVNCLASSLTICKPMLNCLTLAGLLPAAVPWLCLVRSSRSPGTYRTLHSCTTTQVGLEVHWL